MTGQTVSHYRVLEKIGEGGMGVVYKAEDTNLERQVALKFLPAHLLGNREVRKRFEREAKSSAALSHPNVCRVYEIDEAEGETFLAMELIEGESLDKKIAQGPLKLEEALAIAQQAAKGLEAAHKRGIIHRDIKPENIMVGEDGHVTIMDFGLAQLTEASRLTKTDETMGTVAYMSPEQTEGSGTDLHTDIWSLGVVLYEMVTGWQPFKGDYDKAVMYSILNEAHEPITAVRAGVPMELEVFVGKCLAKDPEDRYSAAHELATDLRTLSEKLRSGRSTVLSASIQARGPAAAASPALSRPVDDSAAARPAIRRVERALAISLGVAFVAVSYAYLTQPDPGLDAERALRRFSFPQQGLGAATISPDGRNIVFTVENDGVRSLWLRALGSETVREIPGTDGAERSTPAWSFDSQHLVFGANGQLKRISITGADPVTLCELPSRDAYPLLGVSWSPNGDRVVFSSGRELWTVSARGGDPTLLFDTESDAHYLWPHFLPPGRGRDAIVYQLFGRIEVLNLKTGERTEIGPGRAPVYSRSGHLLYDTAVFAERILSTPFSLDALEATGDPFPVAEGGFAPSVSNDGTLVYAGRSDGSPALRNLVVRKRSGEVLQEVGDHLSARILHPTVAPNGRFVAASVDGDIWVNDLSRNVAMRLTSSVALENCPDWVSDGGEISYKAEVADEHRIVIQAPHDNATATASADSSGRLGLVGRFSLFDWSFDKRYLAYAGSAGGADGPGDGPVVGEGGLWYRERQDDGALSEAKTFLRTPFNENAPQLSPDGRFLAYRSDESGRFEIYVRPFPEGTDKWQVSTGGGVQPRWAADGTELFYAQDSTLVAVPVSTQPDFTFGEAGQLFDGIRPAGSSWSYDVFPDRQRFVTVAFDEEAGASLDTVRIVENWYEEFRNPEQD